MNAWINAEWVDKNIPWTPKEVPELPPRLLIDYATKCNLRCPMCSVWGSDNDEKINEVKGTLNYDASIKILDEVKSIKPLIQPNMYGEPLLAPRFKDHIVNMKSRGISVAINTNGLTLTESLANFLVEVKLDSVMFSIDAATNETLYKIRGVRKLEKIESAVLRMLNIRGKNNLPRIGVSFTLQDDNRNELENFLNKWVGVVDVVRVGLVFIDGEYPDMVVNEPRKPCPALYNTLPIHNDGTASICCLDGFKETNVGNVIEKGVKNIWLGEIFSKVRYYHETNQYDKVPFCKSCNGWSQYDMSEESKDGLLIRKSPQFTYYNKIDRIDSWTPNLLGGHPELVL
jgi:MoaA/NifB/PqqE/SkfB family radical SAM enzyme